MPAPDVPHDCEVEDCEVKAGSKEAFINWYFLSKGPEVFWFCCLEHLSRWVKNAEVAN